MNASTQVGSISKADRLYLLAQGLAEKTPQYFESKGPSRGDHATAQFVRDLTELAKSHFGHDYSQKKACGDAGFTIDFYFPDEATAVELAFGLHNPLTEYERDIFKCLLAQTAGCDVRRLLFIAKPGGKAKQEAPGPRAIAKLVKDRFGLQVNLEELVRPDVYSNVT